METDVEQVSVYSMFISSLPFSSSLDKYNKGGELDETATVESGEITQRKSIC